MTRNACAVVTLLASLAGCATSQAPAPQGETLTAEARSALKKEMERHGKDMEALLESAIALDHEETALRAATLAAGPRLAPSTPGYPHRFLSLHRAMHDEAGRLAAAARDRDDAALAESFGRLTTTCVACHSISRNPGSAQIWGARTPRQ